MLGQNPGRLNLVTRHQQVKEHGLSPGRNSSSPVGPTINQALAPISYPLQIIIPANQVVYTSYNNTTNKLVSSYPVANYVKFRRISLCSRHRIL